MSDAVVVIGAGVGGLTAAALLARAGRRTVVLEARQAPGGLASGLVLDGLAFDAGPYVLLDRPGLAWALESLALDLADLQLTPLELIYEVETSGGTPVRLWADLDETCRGFERIEPGAGMRYDRFCRNVSSIYNRLSPLRFTSKPAPWDVLRAGGPAGALFLLRSLGSVFRASGLPEPIREALGIWTHIAGQKFDQAPSPLAFVPALIHTVGAFVPRSGVARVPDLLYSCAVRAGAEFRFGANVRRILTDSGQVRGVELQCGERISARAVVCNAPAIRAYVEMLDGTSPSYRTELERLPLQSPGVAAYLAIRGEPQPPYLRFRISPDRRRCDLLVAPSATVGNREVQGWRAARLISPMDHSVAETGGPSAQDAHLATLLESDWWKEVTGEHRLLKTRTPGRWGSEYNLYRDSMNPVMTARFMRQGRIAHRSPWFRGLYFAGSSTHPGQWVSFCAISGVLAARLLLEDVK